MLRPFICLRTSVSGPVCNRSQVGLMVTTVPEEVVTRPVTTEHMAPEEVPSCDWGGVVRGRTLIHCQQKKMNAPLLVPKHQLPWLELKGSNATAPCSDRISWPQPWRFSGNPPVPRCWPHRGRPQMHWKLECLSRFKAPHPHSYSQPLPQEFDERIFEEEQGQDSWARAEKQGE